MMAKSNFVCQHRGDAEIVELTRELQLTARGVDRTCNGAHFAGGVEGQLVFGAVRQEERDAGARHDTNGEERIGQSIRLAIEFFE